jgi:proton-dependent oligopeptide transporter, POT family
MNELYWWLLGGWVFVLIWIPPVIASNRHIHPKVLFALFFVELWERFSYYGMRALLVLFLIDEMSKGGFGMKKGQAYSVYAAYGSLVYLTPLLGGFLADKVLGFRKSIIWGAILMALGQFCLSASVGDLMSDRAFLLYTGLALLTIGNGSFKPNISSLVGKFYPPGDVRKDSAYSIFYTGINLGAFLAPLTCGAVGKTEGWQYGFLLAGSGMTLGLILFLFLVRSRWLGEHAEPPATAVGAKFGGIPLSLAVFIGTLLLVPVSGLLLRFDYELKFKVTDEVELSLLDCLLMGIGLLTVLYMLWISTSYDKAQRQRIWVIVVMFFASMIFWTFFELAGSALNVFAEEHVQKSFIGLSVDATFSQAINPFFIIVFAPMASALWLYLARRNRDFSPMVKFSFALFLLGLGFFVPGWGMSFVQSAMMPAIFLVLLYLFHTLGEIALSPVGLSLITKLAPEKIVGLMYGFWFLSSALALKGGKFIANAMAVKEGSTPEESLNQAITVLNQVGFISLGAGLLLLIASPVLKKWMHGVN